LKSGNTFGLRLWSDGFQHAPMLVDPPPIVQCGACTRCFFLNGARRIGDSDEALPNVREPSEAAYYDALRSGMAQNREQERLLRTRAWWRSNDSRRHPPDPAAAGALDPSDERLENLRALLTLLDDGEDSDCVTKGEILRELGRWAEAEAMLDRVQAPEHASIVEQLRTWCSLRNHEVQELRHQARRSIVIRLG
jgi:hypothetical protein